MIQILQQNTTINVNSLRLGLLDGNRGQVGMELFGYKPLISITSQQTNKTKSFLPATLTLGTHGERYVELSWLNWFMSENLTTGIIILGTNDFPFGLYDVKIYSNLVNGNLDPTLAYLNTTTLANVYSPESEIEVKYTSYDNNDANNNVIYQTNQV